MQGQEIRSHGNSAAIGIEWGGKTLVWRRLIALTYLPPWPLAVAP